MRALGPRLILSVYSRRFSMRPLTDTFVQGIGNNLPVRESCAQQGEPMVHQQSTVTSDTKEMNPMAFYRAVTMRNSFGSKPNNRKQFISGATPARMSLRRFSSEFRDGKLSQKQCAGQFLIESSYNIPFSRHWPRRKVISRLHRFVRTILGGTASLDAGRGCNNCLE